jgi:hypothetical protein
MTLFFRFVRSTSIAIWFGSLVFFAFVVARVAFSTMPDAHTAGIIVRGTLIGLHKLGIIAGLVYLVFTLALLGTQRDSHPARAIELALIIAMLAVTVYSQFSVIPRMESDRLSLGGDTSKVSPDDPTRKHFDRLHNLSVKLEGAVMIEALVIILLAPMHGRDDFDRFA